MHYVTWLGQWLKVKCLNRKEFVVVGWTDPVSASVGRLRATGAASDVAHDSMKPS